jgi:hypothetical protein
MSTADDVAEVISRELSLLQPAVRSNPHAVLSLLHDEFREFGASGRTWDKGEIAAALADEPGPGAEARDVQAVPLGADVVLVTYVARRPDRDTLRSSVWVRDLGGWRLFFHQGTSCP